MFRTVFRPLDLLHDYMYQLDERGVLGWQCKMFSLNLTITSSVDSLIGLGHKMEFKYFDKIMSK
jgi:hypothetical protein